MRVLGMTYDEVVEHLARLGQPSYRASQVFAWLHERNCQSFEEMTVLPLSLRSQLATELGSDRCTVTESVPDGDATKLLLGLADGQTVECVAMGRPWGGAACVSSQIGCPVGCEFCASGQQGLVRGLSAGEIVAQVAELRRLDEPVGHLVFMGMGEPLLNLDEVVRSVRVLADKRGLGLPERSMTISTIGILPGLNELANSDLRVRLTLSLHATTDALRSRLIPRWCAPLEEVVPAAVAYSRRARRRLSIAYVLMDGVNDMLEDARRLARIARQARAHVNIIPYNEVPGVRCRRPSRVRIAGFLRALEETGVPVSMRVSVGRQANAACGQLRARASADQASTG